MKIGDVIIHPKFGKGQIVKIFPDKVICLLAGEERQFTPQGAEFMSKEALDKSMGVDFDNTAPKKATTVASTKRYFCKFCPREFELERSMITHQSQCKQNPDFVQWDRVRKPVKDKAAAPPAKKKRGAQPGNKNSARHKAESIPAKTEAIPHNVVQGGGTANISETVRVAWNVYLMDADETKNINQLSWDFLKKLCNGEILK
jgi:hypothetical protein